MATLSALLQFEMPPDGGFSHSETLQIAGLTSQTVLTWYKRRLIPKGWDAKPGRGNRRRYHILQVTVLATARALTDMGVPVTDALWLAGVLSIRVLSLLEQHGGLEPRDAVEKLRDEPHAWVAVYPTPEGLMVDGRPASYPVLLPGEAATEKYAFFHLLGCDTQRGIREWMRERRLVSIGLIDIVSLAVSILSRARDVISARTK